MDNSIEETGAQESPVIQRPLMPDWLFRETVKGNDKIWESENGEADRVDHLELRIEALDAGPSQETKKAEALAYLQSASYMGNTVLHILASHGHTELANVICQKDTSMWRAQNKMFETPFHCAAKAGHKNTISVLIESAREDGEAQLKAVLRGRNKHGDTALHEAAKRGHEGVVFKLMEVDVLLAFEPNNDGTSPLDFAVIRGSYKDSSMVAKMLEQLPNRNIGSEHSCSTLQSVVPNLEVVIQMPQSNGKIPTHIPIRFYAPNRGRRMLSVLLKDDISLAYVQNSDGLFPVHLAAGMGNAEMVALLMKMCPDSGELLDHRGRNFLHVAAEKNKSEILNQFFFGKSDIFMHETIERMFNETDDEGNTPWHLISLQKIDEILSFRAYGHFHILPDYNLQNKKGLTPRDIRHDMVDSNETMQKLQLIGLGAVLITTVAFAVAFTPPGGYDQTKGFPLLAHKYIFKAFILADTLAFVLSVLCVAATVYFGLVSTNFREDLIIKVPLYLLTTAVKCMVLAFGLGLYLTLAPVVKSVGILILVVTLLTAEQEQLVVLIAGDHSTAKKGWASSGILFYVSILFIFLFALLK